MNYRFLPKKWGFFEKKNVPFSEINFVCVRQNILLSPVVKDDIRDDKTGTLFLLAQGYEHVAYDLKI